MYSRGIQILRIATPLYNLVLELAKDIEDKSHVMTMDYIYSGVEVFQRIVIKGNLCNGNYAIQLQWITKRVKEYYDIQ